MNMQTVLVVGAGLSGATVARQLAEQGYTVRVVDQRDHIGGNCYDFVNEQGIRVNQYGAHLFHTSSERVWAYVQRFSEWTPWKHQVIADVQGIFVPVPVNQETVRRLCDPTVTTEPLMKEWLAKQTAPYVTTPQNSEEVALSRVGPLLYRHLFQSYTVKQWDKTPAELDPSVLGRIPVRTDNNPYYFSDPYQALPTNGYTAFFQALLDHPNITVQLNTPYTEDMRATYDFLFYTGPIDLYYRSRNHPPLEYRSIRFETEHLPIDQYQENSVVNHPTTSVPYTRIVEYKHFLNQVAPGRTTIVKEYTTADGDPYYPVPTKANQERYRRYQEWAKEDEAQGVYFVGRLAHYKYYNMDAAIEAALNITDAFLTRAPTELVL
jgi:UDP-galactopyranose mutase